MWHVHLVDAGVMMGAKEVKDARRLFAGVGAVDLITRGLYRTIPVKNEPMIEAG